MKSLSVVIPVYYNEGSLRPLFDALMQVDSELGKQGIRLQLIFVDDGSGDGSLRELLELASGNEAVKVVKHSRNFGAMMALKTGFQFVEGDCFTILTADLQDPPELIPEMIEQWQQGAEVVLARRVDRSSDSFLKRGTSSIFYRVHNHLSSIQLPENVGDFRLMDKMVVDGLKQLPESHRFMKGLFAWVGFETVTLDYVRDPRKAGATKFSGLKLWNFALEGFTSFSTIPLRLWTYIGGIGALVTFFYASFIIVRTIIYGIDIPGYASLLVVVLFFGSLQLISVGILGEYIGRIYMETKNRPVYLIKKRYGVKN
jgi:glycosyltransferase involved in cell wall biosynthesis